MIYIYIYDILYTTYTILYTHIYRLTYIHTIPLAIRTKHECTRSSIEVQTDLYIDISKSNEAATVIEIEIEIKIALTSRGRRDVWQRHVAYILCVLPSKYWII